jgi:hypothetical protein
VRLGVILLTALLLGCSTVRTEDVSMETVGRAESKYCEYFYTREELVYSRCIETKSDAFSGWVVVGEIFQGAANAVVKILTLGLL